MAERTPRPRKGQSLWRDAWRRLRKNRFAMGGLVVVAAMAFVALFADPLMPFEADYGQPWVGARAPGFRHPAVLAELRFDRGRPPAIPERAPRAVARMLGAGDDRTLEYVVHEKARAEHLVRVRKGRVERIQRKEGAAVVPSLAVSGPEEHFVVSVDESAPGIVVREMELVAGRPLPRGFPTLPDDALRIVVVAVERPRTREPETVRVRLRGGLVESIEREGALVDALRLDGRHVRASRVDGRAVELYHPLGTDLQGRDVLTRVVFGGRISLMVGVVATVVSGLIGVVYGAVAGYSAARLVDRWSFVGMVLCAAGVLVAVGATDHWAWAAAASVSWCVAALAGVAAARRALPIAAMRRPVTTAGELMMRVVDILYGIPFMFLVILLMVAFGRDLVVLFIALGAVEWLTMARIVRGQVLSLKEKEFVEAARMCGSSHLAILFRHLVPNTLGVVVVYATLTVPSVILTESFLSFLGLNVEFQGRALDSWGALVNQGRQALSPDGGRWWILVFPSVAMTATLLSLNFLGDGLRDAFDPRLRGRT